MTPKCRLWLAKGIFGLLLSFLTGHKQGPVGAISWVPNAPNLSSLLKTSLFTFLPPYRKGLDIQINDIILTTIPFIHAGHYNLLPGKINSCKIFLNARHSKGSKQERRWEGFWQIFAQVTASSMNTFARGKKWVKKFTVNMKHARLGQENEQGVEKGNF